MGSISSLCRPIVVGLVVVGPFIAITTGVSLELYRTDGAEGAARGAAFGVSHYASLSEALSGLRRDAVVEPNLNRASRYREAYYAWADELTERMS